MRRGRGPFDSGLDGPRHKGCEREPSADEARPRLETIRNLPPAAPCGGNEANRQLFALADL